MLKIAYKDLRDNGFRTAMMKLANCTEYKSHKTGYNVARMIKALEDKLKDSQKEWVALAEPLVEKDEKGNFKIRPDGVAYREGVDPAEAEKKVQAFMEKEVIVDRFKLRLEDLQPAKLSPADMLALDPVVNAELEAVP